MNYEVLESFQPILFSIAERDNSRWLQYNYDVLRESTEVHSLAYMSEGEGHLELNGARFALRKGMLMYVSPKSRMRLTTEPSNLLHYYSVLFRYGQLRWEGTEGVWQNTGDIPLPLNSVYYDRAKQLLIASEMPIGRIAEEVGYTDPLYFSRLFTRLTGVSPRQFRKL